MWQGACAAAFLLASGSAWGQSPAIPAPVGTPRRVASFESVADARSFSVARAGDRALLGYVSSDPRVRGAVRTVLLQSPSAGVLERVGADSVIERPAIAVAVAFDGTRGAVAYVVPRPHRGEEAGDRQRRARGVGTHTPVDPLGASALTAGDIVVQRLDANGAPVGRRIVAFEENARAYRVAVALDGDGVLVAWTGAINSDDEMMGTVRTTRIDAQGHARSFASDTGFVGQVGDVLRIVPRADERRGMRVVWTGERCRPRTDVPPWPPFEGDPSAEIERRVRQLMNQNPPHEHAGPRIECTHLSAFSAEVLPDGTTRPVVDGPALANDALAVIRPRANAWSLVGAAREATGVQIWPLEVDARVGRAVTVPIMATAAARSTATANATANATASTTTTATAAGGSGPEPSTVRPPVPPDGAATLRSPAALDAVASGTGVFLVALSPTRARVVWARTHAAIGPIETTMLAPGVRVWDVGLVAAENGASPWVFAHTGASTGGTVVFMDPATAGTHTAAAEAVWPGDERFRVHLLRVLAARAAETAYANSYGPMALRPENATNPAIPGMAAAFRRTRQRWDAACEPLGERARFLVRHGAPNDLLTFVRQVCEQSGEAPTGEPAAVPVPATAQ